MRYGTSVQQENANTANSLFDDVGGMEIPKPAVPAKVETWSNIARLERERELVGIYLSGHPLDPYVVIMEKLCNTSFSQLKNLGELTGKRLVLAGMVTGVRTGFSKKGNPYGIVKIEDFNGDGEIALFGNKWAQWQNFFKEGCAIMVHAQVEPRRYNPELLDMVVTRVEFLAEIKTSGISEIVVAVNVENLDEMEVDEFLTLIENNPGRPIYNCRLPSQENSGTYV